jgi:hypothetical protein
VGISRTGQRFVFGLEALQRMLAALVTSSGGSALPAEVRELALLQSTGRRYVRMLAVDVSLESTVAGSHVVRARSGSGSSRSGSGGL